MSDLEILAGSSQPEAVDELSARPRRFSRFAAPGPVLRTVGAITEGATSERLGLREGRYRRSLAFADAISAVIALTIIVDWVAGAGFQAWTLLAGPMAVLVHKIGGLYERDELVLSKTTLDEAPSLLKISGLFALIVFIGHHRLVHVSLTPSLVFMLWMTAFIAFFTGRVIARYGAARFSTAERCLVLGDDSAIAVVQSKLPQAGINAEVVAAVRLDPHVDFDGRAFRALIRRHRIDRVILAPVTTDSRDTLDLIRVAKRAGVRVSLLPRLFEVVGSSVEFDHVDGLTMLAVRRFGLTRSSHMLKRAFDLIGSTVILVLAAPLMAVLALGVRLDSRGPILFRQTRVGRIGRPFKILKFRTMVPGAESLKADIAHLNETQGLFKLAEDPRVTRFGRILRRTALDELPQLFNVWRGEMSLVGPRPLVRDEDAKIEGLDRGRLHLTPGMTGHWQILGSGRIPLEEMVGIDYLYVANWSLWTDLKILLRTLPYMVARRGM